MPDEQIEILLVEDNENDAELTIRALKKNKIANNITHLRNGVEAIDFLFGTGQFKGRDVNNRPQVVLLDLKMPKVGGIEVLKAIRSDQQTKTLPVVVLTSSKEDPDVRACYELGVNSYIVKPVEFENFIKSVSELGLYWVLLNQHLK